MKFTEAQQETIEKLIQNMTNDVLSVSGKAKTAEVIEKHALSLADIVLFFGYDNCNNTDVQGDSDVT